MRQLSAQDAAFLYLESQGVHLHLTGLYIYDQATSPDGIVRLHGPSEDNTRPGTAFGVHHRIVQQPQKSRW